MADATKNKPAGFFGRDEDFGTRMDEYYEQGEQFLILDCEQDTPFVNPSLPDGHKDKVVESRTKMTTRKLDPETMSPYGLPVVVKTLAQVIYDHAGAQVTGDFPAVCYWDKVEVKQYNNTATVLRKVADWPLSAEIVAMMKGAA